MAVSMLIVAVCALHLAIRFGYTEHYQLWLHLKRARSEANKQSIGTWNGSNGYRYVWNTNIF